MNPYPGVPFCLTHAVMWAVMVINEYGDAEAHSIIKQGVQRRTLTSLFNFGFIRIERIDRMTGGYVRDFDKVILTQKAHDLLPAFQDIVQAIGIQKRQEIDAHRESIAKTPVPA